MTNLVETVGNIVSKLGIKAAYGDPVTLDGVEIVPVAASYFGFGAGSDTSASNADADTGTDDADTAGSAGGSGGGGGGATFPIGAYVTGVDGPTFRPNIVALLAVLIPLTWVGGKALTAIIKAAKK